MKRLALLFLLSTLNLQLSTAALATESAIDAAYAERIANAIYRVEGGARARVPYGILSVKVKDAAEARRVCLNTIRNNWRRWHAAGRPGDYLDFLADRYCPASVDPVGNRNWKKNIKAILK